MKKLLHVVKVYVYFYRTYLDSHGKKKVTFGDKLQSKVPEKDRPKTPIMKEIQHSIHNKIDENFKGYLQVLFRFRNSLSCIGCIHGLVNTLKVQTAFTERYKIPM